MMLEENIVSNQSITLFWVLVVGGSVLFLKVLEVVLRALINRKNVVSEPNSSPGLLMEPFFTITDKVVFVLVFLQVLTTILVQYVSTKYYKPVPLVFGFLLVMAQTASSCYFQPVYGKKENVIVILPAITYGGGFLVDLDHLPNFTEQTIADSGGQSVERPSGD